MKLRLRGNSVRLRLLRGEVRRLGETGRVAETVQFGLLPAERLTYTIEASATAKQITANFADNHLKILLPDLIARDWVESEQISLASEQTFESNETDSVTLKILIEKDFVCLDRVDDADNKDAYPHPNPNKQRC